MKDINLLPGLENAKKSSFRDTKVILVGSLVVLIPLLVFGYLYLLLNPEIASIEEENRQLDVLIQKYAEVNSVKQEKTAIDVHVTALTAILDLTNRQQNIHTGLLDDVTELMPAEVFAINYSFVAGSMTMNCRSLSEESIAYFLRNLKESGLYQHVSFSGIAKNKATDGTTQDFTFTVTLLRTAS